MPALDRIRRHALLSTACIGALAGVVVGLFLPIRAPSPSRAQEDAWSLPDAAAIARFREAEYQQVRSTRAWAGATPDRRGERSAQWNMIAIVTQPGPRVAASVANGKPAWFRPGSTLPDGSILISITRDGVWYEKDGCRALRRLYASGQQAAAADACVDGATTPPASARPPAPAPGRAAPPTPSTSGSKPSS